MPSGNIGPRVAAAFPGDDRHLLLPAMMRCCPAAYEWCVAAMPQLFSETLHPAAI